MHNLEAVASNKPNVFLCSLVCYHTASSTVRDKVRRLSVALISILIGFFRERERDDLLNNEFSLHSSRQRKCSFLERRVDSGEAGSRMYESRREMINSTTSFPSTLQGKGSECSFSSVEWKRFELRDEERGVTNSSHGFWCRHQASGGSEPERSKFLIPR